MNVLLKSFSTTEINIINKIPIEDEELRVHVGRKFKRNGNTVMLYLTATIDKRNEFSLPEKTFQLECCIEGIFECNNELTKEEIEKSTSLLLMPYLRSNISMLCGIIGISNIQLPFIEFE